MPSSRNSSGSEGCMSVRFSPMHILVVALLSFFAGTMLPSLHHHRSSSSQEVPTLDADAIASIAAETACNETADLSSSSSYSSGASPWCPTATCHNTDLCEPCKRRYLILLATGRSGSTTLMNMMGQLPSVRMAGENNDLLGHLKRMEDDILENPQFVHNHHGDLTDWNGPWRHNPVLNGSLACVSQQMIETINPPLVDREGHYISAETEESKILGFKTIRLLNHMEEKKHDDERVAEWLGNTMPCARFLVNIRSEVEAQADSHSAAFQKKDDVEKLRTMNKRMRNLQKLLGSDRAFMLDSSKWTKKVSLLNEALAWLGYSEECNFTKVLQFNTNGDGYDNGDVDTSNLMIDSSNCRHVGADVGKDL
eukprot:CAMPEP_0194054970 /NCGR_PEP_ID=MMETSP0009_2-20130614/55179_1 /TAXON_ID=210454 /ORGANISM="Grammatophora oceanica, Strain CCMP 410" /LENGTH=366 /DNA_ID=CAMNT_0038703705 /DNA_START=53 /DNA_END=1153 /DNA_ORIENTATION=+